MITVRATPLAFISASSVSGAASRSGTRAPSANGNAGSCFHTWTWGSMIRESAARALAATPASSVRRVTSVRDESDFGILDDLGVSDIGRLQLVDDVSGRSDRPTPQPSDPPQLGHAAHFDPFHDKDVALVVEAGAVRGDEFPGGEVIAR